MNQPQLAPETIQACTNETSYARGMKYYQQGRVVERMQTESVMTAVVIGTDRYKVSLDSSNLDGTCNCYVAGGNIWCKHIVAVALSVTLGEVVASEEPMIKKTGRLTTTVSSLETELDLQTAATLSSIIKTAGEAHPDIWEVVQHVLHPPIIEQPADILTAVKQALAPVNRARTWERQTTAAIQACEDMRYVADAAPATEAAVRALLQAAVWAYGQLERIDDSDGDIQDGIGALVEKAITVVNAHHEWIAHLYEPLAETTELPMLDYIFAVGDTTVQADCVQRLDKHRYTRDPHFVTLDQEHTSYTLADYYAARGDNRLLALLDEVKFHENTHRNMLVTYHTQREEWQQLVDMLWPLRDDFYHASSLRRALQGLGDHDKLITLQTEDTLRANDPERSLAILEHMLRTAGRADELPGVVERVLKGESLSFDARFRLLVKLRQFTEAAQVCLQALEKKPVQYAFYDAATVLNEITACAHKLSAVSAEDAKTVWRTLFAMEAERVVRSSNYTRFETLCSHLYDLDDRVWLEPRLLDIIRHYPTRKKLVALCEQYAV